MSTVYLFTSLLAFMFIDTLLSICYYNQRGGYCEKIII